MAKLEVQISSVLLASANVIFDQTKQNGMSLWGSDEDMTATVGSRTKRIAFFVWSLLAAALFIFYGYTYAVVYATLATAENPDRAKQYDQAARINEANKTDTFTESADMEKATEPSAPSTASSTSLTGPFPQSNEFIRRITHENETPTGIRYGLVYLLLSELLSSVLNYYLGTSRPIQWAVHMITCVSLSGMRMLWTHAVVADPAFKPTYHRSLAAWARAYQALLLPSVVYAALQPAMALATQQVTISLVSLAARKNLSWPMLLLWVVAILFASALVPSVLIFICGSPALFVLNRVEVSLLTQEIRTIVVRYDSADEKTSAYLEIGEEKASLYNTYIAPTVHAWKSIDRRGQMIFRWDCVWIALRLAVPASQFLQASGVLEVR